MRMGTVGSASRKDRERDVDRYIHIVHNGGQRSFDPRYIVINQLKLPVP